jgi:transmembrane sensor
MSVLTFLKRYPVRASEWFARMRGEEFDEQSDQKWQEWMAVDTMNPVEMDNTELAFELTEELRHRPAIEQLLADVDQRMAGGGHRQGAQMSRLRLTAVAAVAATLVAAVVGYIVLTHVTVTEYATDVGEQKVVTLADSSTVSLNTATRIRVEYSRRLRRIELLDGEAAFAVQHDTARPFVVGALRGTTTAVGTEFVVQVKPTVADVSVIQGTVTVQSLANDPGHPMATLSMGQSVRYELDGTVAAVHPADLTKLRAWQAHRIVFNDVPLADAVQEYNRYVKTPIVVGDAALASRHVNGVFKIGDKSAFLGALEKGLHVRIAESDTEVRIEPEP